MTRRERLIRIIENSDYRIKREAEGRVAARLGYDLFSDDALELYAREILNTHKRVQEMNARNRARANGEKVDG